MWISKLLRLGRHNPRMTTSYSVWDILAHVSTRIGYVPAWPGKHRVEVPAHYRRYQRYRVKLTPGFDAVRYAWLALSGISLFKVEV